MSGPFKMKGSGHYGHGNQKRKDGMPFVEAAMGIAKQVGGMMSKKNEEKTPATYASPAKVDEKETKTLTNEVKVTEKKPKHKDVTSRGGWNEEISKGIKSGRTKVYERSDGSTYTKTIAD
tara:strand:- start:6 stop:365 length:360 start_codon:yes stop_codon:yes gene_type:complete